MMLRRELGVSLLTPQGRVLVIGGGGNNPESLRSAESYDPATKAWSSAGYLTAPRIEHAGAVLATGEVVVVGGDTGCGSACVTDSAEVYDGVTVTAVPYPPSSLRSTTADGTISFGWDAPTRTGSGPLTGYTVKLSSSEGTRLFDVSPSQNTIVITGLTNGVRYTATVFARNVSGSSFSSVPRTDKPFAL